METQVPLDEWIGAKVIAASAVTTSTVRPDGRRGRTVRVTFEATSPELDGATATAFVGFSVDGEKSRLRKIATAALGADFDTNSFVLGDLVGRELLIMGGNTRNGAIVLDRFKAKRR